MGVLVGGCGLFLAAFLVHLGLWKVRRPQRQTRALLRIFVLVLLAGLGSRPLFPGAWAALGLPAADPGGLAHAVLLYTVLVLAYITTYSGIEVDSPSLVMTKVVADAEPAGIARDAFFAELGDDRLVAPRVRDLLRDRLARLEGDRYVPTLKGARVAALFRAARLVLGLTEPGG